MVPSIGFSFTLTKSMFYLGPSQIGLIQHQRGLVKKISRLTSLFIFLLNKHFAKT